MKVNKTATLITVMAVAVLLVAAGTYLTQDKKSSIEGTYVFYDGCEAFLEGDDYQFFDYYTTGGYDKMILTTDGDFGIIEWGPGKIIGSCISDRYIFSGSFEQSGYTFLVTDYITVSNGVLVCSAVGQDIDGNIEYAGFSVFAKEGASVTPSEPESPVTTGDIYRSIEMHMSYNGETLDMSGSELITEFIDHKKAIYAVHSTMTTDGAVSTETSLAVVNGTGRMCVISPGTNIYSEMHFFNDAMVINSSFTLDDSLIQASSVSKKGDDVPEIESIDLSGKTYTGKMSVFDGTKTVKDISVTYEFKEQQEDHVIMKITAGDNSVTVSMQAVKSNDGYYVTRQGPAELFGHQAIVTVRGMISDDLTEMTLSGTFQAYNGTIYAMKSTTSLADMEMPELTQLKQRTP